MTDIQTGFVVVPSLVMLALGCAAVLLCFAAGALNDQMPDAAGSLTHDEEEQ